MSANFSTKAVSQDMIRELSEENFILKSALLALLANDSDDARFGDRFARWRKSTIDDLDWARQKTVDALNNSFPEPVWGLQFLVSAAHNNTNYNAVEFLTPYLNQAMNEVYGRPRVLNKPTMVTDDDEMWLRLDAFLRNRIVELLREHYRGDSYGPVDENGNNAYVRIYLPAIDVLFEKAERHILRFKLSLYGKIWTPMKKSQLATMSRKRN